MSSAPPTGTTLCGWARSPSAPATASSGSTAQLRCRNRSRTAAAVNDASSALVITPGPLASSRGADRCAKPAARFPPPRISAASPALAATPSTDPRSAHGAGGGAGARPSCSLARADPASPPNAAASPPNSTQRKIAVGHCPGTDGRAAAGALPSDAGAGPTANLNWSPTRSPSLEMTCQLTVYTPSGRRPVTGTVTTLRPPPSRAGPSAILRPPAPVSVTGVPARVTDSLNVSVTAFGETGTALSAAGEVNSSVACAEAAGATATCMTPATVSAPSTPETRRMTRSAPRTARFIRQWRTPRAEPGPLVPPRRAHPQPGRRPRRRA